MKNESKTKQQLLAELAALRQRLAELEIAETKRQQAEAALQASETRYRRLFETAQDGILILDADTGQITDVNPFLMEMLGYSEEEFVGKKLWEIGSFKDIEASRAAFAELQYSGYIRYEDLPLETSAGGRIEVEFVSNVYLVDHKRVIQCNIRDITGRKRAEEVAIQTSRLEVAATLAGGVAHRVNNLMTRVLGYAELLKADLIGQSRSLEMLETIARSAQETSDLAQQMLAFAQGGKYQPRPINLNDTVNEVLYLWLERHTMPANIRLLRHLAPDLWHVKADVAQMGQILVNLLTNALEAMAGGGRITVSTKNIMMTKEMSGGFRLGPHICLAIEDIGSGMSEEVQSKVFEPFFTTKFQGRGLGLPAVYGIVQNHDGNVVIHSQPGQGTKVMVYLPALLPLEQVEAQSLSLTTQAVAAGAETVLVVEDDKAVREVTQFMLKSLGYQVLAAGGGLEAVELAQREDGKIHLALLDMEMPVMNGSKIYPLLTQARPGLKVIVYSGHELDASVQALLDAGARAFIYKPFDLKTLAAEVRRVLDS